MEQTLHYFQSPCRYSEARNLENTLKPVKREEKVLTLANETAVPADESDENRQSLLGAKISQIEVTAIQEEVEREGKPDHARGNEHVNKEHVPVVEDGVAPHHFQEISHPMLSLVEGEEGVERADHEVEDHH